MPTFTVEYATYFEKMRLNNSQDVFCSVLFSQNIRNILNKKKLSCVALSRNVHTFYPQSSPPIHSTRIDKSRKSGVGKTNKVKNYRNKNSARDKMENTRPKIDEVKFKRSTDSKTFWAVYFRKFLARDYHNILRDMLGWLKYSFGLKGGLISWKVVMVFGNTKHGLYCHDIILWNALSYFLLS